MAKSLKKEVHAELTPCMTTVIIIGNIIMTIFMMMLFNPASLP